MQDIRADVAEMKTDHGNRLAAIEETLRRQGERLDVHSDNFADISGWLRDIRGLLKDYSVAQELRKITADLGRRISALENRRQ